ncbi:MAG: SH3 domain-containing protein [Myxococcota bacterium]
MTRARAGWFVVLFAAGAALAVSKGGTLYVRSKNTRVFQSPEPTARVLQMIQPGEEVMWLGSVEGEPRWHRVQVVDGGTQGVVYQTNLSPNAPRKELLASQGDKEVDPRAFASSAAAIKGLGPGAIEYGKLTAADPLGDLLAAVELSRRITLKEVTAHTSKHGLAEVGPPPPPETSANPAPQKKGKKR